MDDDVVTDLSSEGMRKMSRPRCPAVCLVHQRCNASGEKKRLLPLLPRSIDVSSESKLSEYMYLSLAYVC